MSVRKTNPRPSSAAAAYRRADKTDKEPRPSVTEGFLKLVGGKGFVKAAKLLLLLDKDGASEILSRLSTAETEALVREISAIRRIDVVEARELLKEFGLYFEEERIRGGVETARNILTLAFGAERAAEIITAAVPESLPKPLDFLDDLESGQMISLLRKEPPETVALVLTQLEPGQASRVFESLPPDDRVRAALRIARTARVNREVLETIDKTLREKLRLIGKNDTEELDGRAALAGILKYMDLSDERRLLGELEKKDVRLAAGVKEKLYTMDTVLHLRDRDLQHVLADLEEKEIALILKGQEREIREKFFLSLSPRRRVLVQDESDIMGPVRRSEADEAARRFLELVREREEAGTYIVIREESDLV